MSVFRFHLLELRFATLIFVKAAKNSRGPELGSAEEGNNQLLNKVWCLQVIEQ